MQTWEENRRLELERLEVPGGWLVRSGSTAGGTALTFMPDSQHTWTWQDDPPKEPQFRFTRPAKDL
jgi:hypothetical protein